jgi:hypothetical protein
MINMSKRFGKKITIGFLVAGLILSLAVYASANVNIAAKIHPKTGMSLNFDAVSFEGSVGDVAALSTYSQEEVGVNTPELSVRFQENYTVSVSGTNLVDLNNNSLQVERLKVSLDGGANISVSEAGEIIDSGSSTTGNTRLTKSFALTLDLSDEANSYIDNETLTNLADTADLSTTITISFTGL